MTSYRKHHIYNKSKRTVRQLEPHTCDVQTLLKVTNANVWKKQATDGFIWYFTPTAITEIA